MVKNEASAGVALQVGDKLKWQFQYDFRADAKKPEARTVMLKVDGKEFKNADAHVLLVDLTLAKPTVRAVKLALPTKVPDLKAGINEWGAAVQGFLSDLEKKSPEVRGFLGAK